jgi:hypothetical protein
MGGRMICAFTSAELELATSRAESAGSVCRLGGLALLGTGGDLADRLTGMTGPGGELALVG